jgi:hypothetical protein
MIIRFSATRNTAAFPVVFIDEILSSIKECEFELGLKHSENEYL